MNGRLKIMLTATKVTKPRDVVLVSILDKLPKALTLFLSTATLRKSKRA